MRNLHLQWNNTVLICYKLIRNSYDSVHKCMGRLRVQERDCKYIEVDRRLKEQFINGINNQAMTAEIIRE